MTNTETVGTERLTEYEMQVLIGTTIHGCNMSPDRVFSLDMAWHRLHAIGLIDRADGLAIATDKGQAVVDAALASRTQDPAEWPDKCHPSHVTRVSVDASSYDEICINCGATDMVIGGWGELRKPCSAASIPAPERSKEETGVRALEIAKRWAIWIDDASAGEEDEGGYLRATFEADKATLLSALETPPLHKEGEAQCCVCGKKGLSTVEGDGGTECQLEDGRWTCSQDCYYTAIDWFSRSAAPVPVPVTITNRMVNIAWAEFNAKTHATHLDAMRAAITAALSNPGEQG